MSYQSIVTGDGAISFWWLGETSGSTAADSADSNPGTYQSGCTLNQAGLLPGVPSQASVKCAGGSSFTGITIGNPSNLNVGDTFTLEIWAMPTSFSAGNMTLIGGNGNNGASGAYVYRVDTSGKVEILKSNVASIGTSTIALSLNTAYHIVWTKATSTNHIYVNGVDVTGSISNQTIGSTSDVDIGGQDGTVYDGFTGYLQAAAIYGSALSAFQVANHYNAGIGTPFPKPYIKTQAVTRASFR